MTQEEKLKRVIPLTFEQILHEFIPERDSRCRISNDLAVLLSVIDVDEEFIHIEFPNGLNNYTAPVLWRITEWRESYKRYERMKENLRLESAVRTAEQATIRKLLRQINHVIPPGDSRELQNSNEMQATVMVKHRKLDRIKMFSVRVDDLVEADKELRSFQQKLKTKKDTAQ